MLKIIVNNKEVDLGKLKGITLQYNGGVFEFDKIEGSYTIPFKLPFSEINNNIFKYAYRLESKDLGLLELDAELWHSNLLIVKGSLTVRLYTSDFNCIFYPSSGDLYRKLNRKKLNEWDFGSKKPFESKPEYDFNTDDFVMYPVYNPDFFLDTGYVGTATNPDHEKWQNFYFKGNFIFNEYEPSILTPFMLLYKVIGYLFNDDLKFDYENTFFIGDYKRLNIFNINNNIIYWVLNSTGFLKEIKFLKPNQYNIKDHLPDMPSEDFILAVQNFFNIHFLTDSNNKIKTIDRKSMVESTSYEDYNSKFIKIQSKLNIEPFNGYNLSVNIDSNDSELSWVENYGESKNVKYSYLAYNSTFGTYGTTMPDDILHATRFWFIARKDSWYSSYENKWLFRHMWLMITNSKLRNLNYFQTFSHEDKGLDIKIAITPLSDYNFDVNPYNDNDYKGNTPGHYDPRVKMKGNMFFGKKNPFLFRLMSYVAIGEEKPDGTIANAPFGTQAFGDVEISSYWSYQNRWKSFIEWYQKSRITEFEAYFSLTASELRNFDFTKKKLIDKNLFFIKSFKVQLLRNSIAPIKAKLIKA